MSQNSGDIHTPENERSDGDGERDGKKTNQELKDKVRKMEKKIASLEKKSEKLKKWKRKYGSTDRKVKKRMASPVRLDFGSDEDDEGSGKEAPQKGFSDVETDQTNPDWEGGEEEIQKSQGSYTHSLSVFDRLGNKISAKDLRHKLDAKKERQTRRTKDTRSHSKGSQSYKRDKSVSKSNNFSKGDDDGRSYSSQHNGDGQDSTEDSSDDGSQFTDGEDEHYKVKDLREALKKLKLEKQSLEGLTVASPFTKKVRDSPLPPKYRGVGDLKFGGTTDPVEYLSRFDTEMEVYQVKDLTKCRLLAATLRDSAHQWFKRLRPNSIRSWRQMSELFVTQFRASVAFAPPANTLANIKQDRNETLTEYFKRFNAEVPKVRKTTDETYKNFLIAGVRPGTDFWKELQGAEPKTLADFYAKAETHKVVEESMAKLEKSRSSREWSRSKRRRSHSPKDRGYHKRTSYGGSSSTRSTHHNEKTTPLTVNATDAGRIVSYKYPTRSHSRDTAKYAEYTPLAASVEHVLEVGSKAGMFRKPIRNGPPGRKDVGPYCAFHDSNGHGTTDCRHLKDRIEDLIRRGYLTEFVAKEAKRYKDEKAGRDAEGVNLERTTRANSIRTIIGGPYIGGTSMNARKSYTREARGAPLTNVYHLTERPPKLFKGEAADITFTEEDARHVHHPHNDALVVKVAIGGLKVYRVLVDNGSSVNILAYSTYQKMGMLDKEMAPSYNELYGFTGNPMQIVGRVKLPITLGEEPRSTTQIAEFMVINENISYNGILGRPLLKEMRVVTSIYHLSMKFPTPGGIGCIQGCQSDSRECYSKALHAAEQSCKHLLLMDGGPTDEQCYRYLEPVGQQVDEPPPWKEAKSVRGTCNVITTLQHQGGKPHYHAAFSCGKDTCDKMLVLEAPKYQDTEVMEPLIRKMMEEVLDDNIGNFDDENCLTKITKAKWPGEKQPEPDQGYTPLISGTCYNYRSIMPFGLSNAGSTYQKSINLMPTATGPIIKCGHDFLENKGKHHLHLNMMEGNQRTSQLKPEVHQLKTRKYPDGGVRIPFLAGDLVLRKQMSHSKTSGHGIFEAIWEGPYVIISILGEGTYHLAGSDGKLIPEAWNAKYLRKYYQ